MAFLKRWLPFALWAGLILSSANDSFSSGQTQGWMDWLLGRDVPELFNHFMRKGAHVVVYGILGALAWLGDRRIAVCLGATALVAIADEVRQSMTATRSGSGWDVLLDLGGAALAIVIVIPAVRARLASRRTAA